MKKYALVSRGTYKSGRKYCGYFVKLGPCYIEVGKAEKAMVFNNKKLAEFFAKNKGLTRFKAEPLPATH
jgi:hypothetical protein